jgi:hypothetical protein
MENQEIVKEIKETMAKVQGSSNMLMNGKIILAYNKLLGINQKLGLLVAKMEGIDVKRVRVQPEQDNGKDN